MGIRVVGQTINLQGIEDSKYITEIGDNGIRVHPAKETTETTSIQLDGTGLDIRKGTISIAKYGESTRIGKVDSSRFLIETDSLEAYDNDNNKYFHVDSNGLRWGDNTAATVAQTTDAAKTATNFLSTISGTNGISIHNINNIDDYINITDNTINMVTDNVSRLKAYIENNIAKLRIGDESHGNIILDSNNIHIKKGAIEIADFSGNTISLGKNSPYSVINLCKELIQIMGEDAGSTPTKRLQAKINFPGDISSDYYAKEVILDAPWSGQREEEYDTLTFDADSNLTLRGGYFESGFSLTSASDQIYDYTSGAAAGDTIHTVGHSEISGNAGAGISYILLSSDFLYKNYAIDRATKAQIQIYGIYGSTSRINFYSDSIYSSVPIQTSSDRRLKDHQSYLGIEADDFIRSLKPAHFLKDNKPHVGFYAQDVEAVDKWRCMTGEMDGFKTLGYTEIIAPLVAYCQHLEKRIEQLEEKE